MTHSGAGALSARSSNILKPCPVRFPARSHRSRQHEEAAHRVAKAYWQEILRQPNATLREHVAPACREPGIAAARAVSTANRQVVLAALKRSQHVGQLGFVVLQVSIDNRDELRRG